MESDVCRFVSRVSTVSSKRKAAKVFNLERSINDTFHFSNNAPARTPQTLILAIQEGSELALFKSKQQVQMCFTVNNYCDMQKVTFEELIKSYKSLQYSRRRNKISDIIENVWMTRVNEQNEAISSEEEVSLKVITNERVIMIEFNDPNKIEGVIKPFRTITEYTQPTIDTVVLRQKGLNITLFTRFRFASEKSRDQFLSEASLLSSDSGNSTESTEESSE